MLFRSGTEVAKIDPSTNEVIEYLEVGRGPQALLVHNNEILFLERIIPMIGIPHIMVQQKSEQKLLKRLMDLVPLVEDP